MDVRMPDGTVVRGVPDGTSQSELMRRYELFKGPQASAVPEDVQVPEMEDRRYESPDPFTRMSPALGPAMALSMGVPGGQVLAPAALFGLGYGARRALEPGVSAGEAAGEGAWEATKYAGGAALVKGGLALAEKLLGPGATQAEQRAANAASRAGLPLPASGRGGAVLQASKGTVPGDLMVRSRMNRAMDYVEGEAARLSGGGQAPETVAQNVARTLQGALQKGREATDEAYTAFETAIGKDTVVQAPTFGSVLQSAAERVRQTGLDKTPLGRKVLAMAENPSPRGWVFKDLEEVRKALKGTAGTRELSDDLRAALTTDYEALGKSLGVDLPALVGKAGQQAKALIELRQTPGFAQFVRDPRNAAGYVESLVSGANVELLGRLRTLDPALHQQLLQSRLGIAFQKAMKAQEGAERAVLDGNALRAWFETSKTWLRQVYGGEVTQALDNFSRYAKAAYPESLRAARPLGVMPTLGRLGGEAAALSGVLPGVSPVGAGLTEAGALYLAGALTNPNSALSKLFARGGFEKGLTAALTRGGGLGALTAFEELKP